MDPIDDYIQTRYDKVLSYLYSKGVNCLAILKSLTPCGALIYLLSLYDNQVSLIVFMLIGTFMCLYFMPISYLMYRDMEKIEKHIERPGSAMPFLFFGPDKILTEIMKAFFINCFLGTFIYMFSLFSAPNGIMIIALNFTWTGIYLVCLYGCSAHHVPPAKKDKKVATIHDICPNLT